MIRITEPAHGAVLNRLHGKPRDGGLEIAVRGTAPRGHAVSVNGAPARRAGEEFRADILLRDAETDLVAAAGGTGGTAEHRIRVVWDRASFPRYRFSIDDNSFFLRDVASHRYRSLFDCPYLGVLKDLNTRFGAKFVLNLFYSTPEADFGLDRFPADYRAEWADAAGWLKLSFHAHAEFPDRPYQYAPAEKLARDFDLVAGEIIRFAGESSWSPPTVIHWGMVPPASFPVLAARGVRVLSGFFTPLAGGGYVVDGQATGIGAAAPVRQFDVNYLLDEERSEYLARHDALKDFASGIVFSRVDIVCNNTPVDRVGATLEPLCADPATAEVMDLFTHEQYFWPFYHGHRPDHAARCEAAIRFCTERGYRPVFFHEGLLGA
jgi:hypothetical protein